MKRIVIYLLTVLLWANASGQVAPQKYFIEFTDRYNSGFSVTRPNEFLSQRAIDRRQRQGIPVEENDLPVNQSYVTRILQIGATVLTRSKWFNGVTVYCLDSRIIDSIMRLPFVKKVHYDRLSYSITNTYSDYKSNSFEVIICDNIKRDPFPWFVDKSNQKFNYGLSFNQIHMVNGDSLHKLGYRGEGMVIALLDGGFLNADLLPAFDSLRINNQILGTRDFVKPGSDVYREAEHGMYVLSCLGANLPGELIGTAPKAEYWLLRSEDVNSEFIIEEYNWVSAAEFADSAGVDVINSSLGYTTFNDPLQDHTCQDMNGNSTPATRGANLAVSKGMIVVSSAGNSGATSWKCVSSPADGYGVLAVAAVDSNGVRADFSSVGEATLRIKPNVAALGRKAVVASTAGSVMYNSGTSFASPILAGVVACMWQSVPDWSNQLITRAIELSSSQVNHPDSLLGYGIPDAIKALKLLGVEGQKAVTERLIISPNPSKEGFLLRFSAAHAGSVTLTVTNTLGRIIWTREDIAVRAGENTISISGGGFDIPSGSYILHVSGRNLNLHSTLVRLDY